MVVCTFISILTVIIGFAISKYAVDHSPTVADIVFADGHRQSKYPILFGPLFVQVLWCFVLIYYCVTWNRFVRRGIERTTEYNARHQTQLDLAWTLRRVCAGLLVWDAFVLGLVSWAAITVI
jgi:hypothetical protein